MKLLGIVTIYHPDTKLLRESLLRYVGSLDKLLLWVNSPVDDMDIIERLNLPEEVKDKCEVMTSGKNEFISYPMNRAVEYGLEHGYTHLLTMDQDSLFDEASFEHYINLIGNANQKAVYSPRIQTEAFVDAIEHRRSIEDLKGLPEPEVVKCSITSGTIYPLKMFHTTGLFREDYQIDMVDVEIGVRAGLCGFPTYKFNSIALRQKYGNTVIINGRVVFNYSAMRRYYFARNRVIFKREYPDSEKWSHIAQTLMRESVKIILFEDKKLKKLLAGIRGFFEGFTRHVVRMDEEIKRGRIFKVIKEINTKDKINY